MNEPQRQRRPGGGSEQVARVSAADTLALAAVEGTKTFVKSHPVLTASWVLGLMLSVFAAGFAPAPEALQAYEAKLDSLEPVRRGRVWSASVIYLQLLICIQKSTSCLQENLPILDAFLFNISATQVTDELAKAEEQTWRAQQSYER